MEQVKTKAALRRSPAEMYPLMKAYAASGQTQAAFCASEGLKVATFQYWWRRYRADQEPDKGGGFVALEPEGKVPAQSGIELHYGAVRLRLSGVPAEYVAKLVHQLAGSC